MVKFWLLVMLCALTLLAAACRDETPVPFARDEQARIDCSEACAARGQCGTLIDDTRAVLANEGGPAVSLHNRFFLQDTLVTVVETSARELIAARDGVPLIAEATSFPHLFYRVTGEGKDAWVSEWCLARP
jgi:hypothetical protein